MIKINHPTQLRQFTGAQSKLKKCELVKKLSIYFTDLFCVPIHKTGHKSI